MMINGTIHEEDVTLVNIYAPNLRALKLLTDLKRETDKNTIIVNTPWIDHLKRKSIRKFQP